MIKRDAPQEKIVAPVVPATSIPVVQPRKSNVQELIANVSSNRGQVVFPSDPWGFTRDVKKALLEAAGNVRGNDVKLQLLLETLAVGLAHARKRFPEDKTKLERIAATQAKYAEDRAPRERWAPSKVEVKNGTN